MWGKIIIPIYKLWLHGLYGLYGPRCPLSPKRSINLIYPPLSPIVEIDGHHFNLKMSYQHRIVSMHSIKPNITYLFTSIGYHILEIMVVKPYQPFCYCIWSMRMYSKWSINSCSKSEQILWLKHCVETPPTATQMANDVLYPWYIYRTAL